MKWFTLSDRSFNQCQNHLVLIIDDWIKPTLYMEDITINTGDPFNPYDGVSIEDNAGIPHLYTFPNNVDTTNPGTIIITYVVVDQRGNYTTQDRLVTILPKQEKPDVFSYMPVLLLTLTSVLIGYIIYRRR